MNGEAQADLSNWRRPPHSRWAFQHVDALMPVARIAHDPARTVALGDAAADDPHTGAPASFATRGGEVPWPEFLRTTATDALLVLHGQRVVTEFHDHGMTPRTPHIVMSASKSVAGLVAGLLEHRGLLDPGQLVGALVPEVMDSPYRDVTLRDLLDMRSGVRPDVAAAAAYAAATGWDPVPDGARTDMRRFFASWQGEPARPGGPFAYVSANTDLLGWALERAGGRSYAELIGELVWQPMGAQQDGFITTDAAGLARATGGICATLRDLARLGLLVCGAATRGTGPAARGSGSAVPPEWLADVLEQGDPQAWRDGEFARGFGELPMHYRSGWYVIDSRPRVLFAMGIHGQHLMVEPELGLVMAKLSSQAAPVDAHAIELTLAAFFAMRQRLA